MKISLGTIDVSKRQREAIGNYYGTKIASRDTCRRFIVYNGYESIYDQLVLLDEKQELRA